MPNYSELRGLVFDMLGILTAEQVAELLRCTPETVREKTPHIIPGAKFGRDWVYSRMLLVAAVERESNEAASNARVATLLNQSLASFVTRLPLHAARSASI